MQTTKKHTVRKNSKMQKAQVVYIVKSEVPSGNALFADKLKKVNKMLENAVLMKH